MALATFGRANEEPTLLRKLLSLNWLLLVAVLGATAIGIMMLYSVAGGSWTPWALRQGVIAGLGLVMLLVIAMIPPQIWMLVAYPAYGGTVVLLLAVEAIGRIGKGAQRWIDLGFFQLQPSELMKIALVLALARTSAIFIYEEAIKLKSLIVPMGLIFLPVALVLMQPNLGTAAILTLIGATILFVSGLRWWIIITTVTAIAVAIPLTWEFALHDYQKERVNTFLNPESDPRGAGYNIIQAKIAMGSGGLTGKGFMDGTQSQLDYVPEKQTDFIFVMLGEEFGLAGAALLMGLYFLAIAMSVLISINARSFFGRVMVLGLTVNFFAYILVNTAMVMGLIPVVGIPLPLMSYGGTAMLTVMAGFGLVMSVHVHNSFESSRRGGGW